MKLSANNRRWAELHPASAPAAAPGPAPPQTQGLLQAPGPLRCPLRCSTNLAMASAMPALHSAPAAPPTFWPNSAGSLAMASAAQTNLFGDVPDLRQIAALRAHAQRPTTPRMSGAQRPTTPRMLDAPRPTT